MSQSRINQNLESSFIPLIEKQLLYHGFRQAFEIKNKKLLLIHYDNNSYLIENKCGHFGVKLDDAIVEKRYEQLVIICNQHFISFDLSSGEVVNRPWENCDPLTIINLAFEGDMLGFYLRS